VDDLMSIKEIIPVALQDDFNNKLKELEK